MKCGRNFWLNIVLILSANVCHLHSEPNTNGVPAVCKVESAHSKAETGIASYYADKYHGKPTASGEIFDMHKLTAAHRSLRFGTQLKVTHEANKRSVIVRVNDRGPFIDGRIIDLSLAAAEELQMVQAGVATVRLEVIN